MTDLEARLRAAVGALPEAPEVPWAARRAAAEATVGAPAKPGLLDRARRRRARIGGALALAAVLSGAGLAAAGILPFNVTEAVHTDVRTETLREVAENEHARLLVGESTHPGLECIVLADDTGATVGCDLPENLPRQGGVAIRAFRPDGSSTMVLHLPRDRTVTSLEVGGRVIPAPAVPLALLNVGPEDRAVVVNTDAGRIVHRFEPGSEAFDIGVD